MLPGVIMRRKTWRRSQWLVRSIFLHPAQWTPPALCLCNMPLFVIRRLWVDEKALLWREVTGRIVSNRAVECVKRSCQFKHFFDLLSCVRSRKVDLKKNTFRLNHYEERLLAKIRPNVGDFVACVLTQFCALLPRNISQASYTYLKKSPFWKCSHRQM